MPASDFSDASGEGANFYGADASGSNFTDANFMGTFFYSTNLQDADFTGTNLIHADLSSADLSGATFKQTRIYYTHCNDQTKLPDGYICKEGWVEKEEDQSHE